MTRSRFLALMTLATFPSMTRPVQAAAEENPRHGCFELRIYHAAEGKLEALSTRFRDLITKLFTRHGMTNVAYWVPVGKQGNTLVYLLSYPDLAARETSWKAFLEDPEWIAAKAEYEKTEALFEKIESRLLGLTDFSPEMKVPAEGAPHVFEMRTYTTTPGNLSHLLKRFKDHTLGLFSKQGMGHYGYFTPLPGQPGADDTLIYFLYHASVPARKASFAAFGADPDWKKARMESETAAGGPLTAPAGVKSQLLVATDFSPVK